MPTRSGASAQAVLQAAEVALADAREAGSDRVVIFQRSSFSADVEVDVPEASETQLG